MRAPSMFDFFRRKPPPPTEPAPPPTPRPRMPRRSRRCRPRQAGCPPGRSGGGRRGRARRADAGAVVAPLRAAARARRRPGAPPRPSADEPKLSWRDRLKAGLGLSRERLAGALTGVFRRRTLDDEALEDLETALLQADVGVDATSHLIDDLPERYRRAGADADPRRVLRDALADLLAPLERPLTVGERPPVRDHDRRRQRRGQDDVDRQARQVAADRRTCRCCSRPATRSARRRASSSSPGASATASRWSSSRAAIRPP